MAATSTTHLIWERNTEKQSRTWAYWVIGAMMALCGFGAFAAFMADRPGQIVTFLVLGIVVSALIWLIPVAFDWGRRRNPKIWMEGRELCWAKVRVPIDDVDRWAATISTMMHLTGSMWSRTEVGVVSFVMKDGDTRKAFNFAHLTDGELTTLIAAIDPILPGRRTSQPDNPPNQASS